MIVLYILIAVFGADRIVSLADDTGLVGVSLGLFLLPLTVVLILICYLKGERPRWRWGEEKK